MVAGLIARELGLDLYQVDLAKVVSKYIGETEKNLARVFEAAGTDLAHVVQTRNYVRDEADVPLYNQLYREYFKSPFPARTTIVRCLPPTMRFEIEAIAVKKK